MLPERLRLAALVAIAAVLPFAASAQVAVDDDFTVDQNSRNNRLNLLENDVSSGSAYIFVVSNPDQGGQVAISRNRQYVRYTPASGFLGTETFRYTSYNGGFWTATVTVHVVGSNSPPRAVDDRYQAAGDATLTVDAATGILSNDSDPDGDTLTATVTDTVRHGSLSLRTDGSFTYVPAPGFTGRDEFGYLASDGSGGSDTAKVTIDVVLIDDPPVIGPIPDQLAYVGSSFDLDLRDFVTDADTPVENLTFEPQSGLPAGLTLSPDGLVSGSPDVGTTGIHSVRFSVRDTSNTVSGAFGLQVDDARLPDLSVEIDASPNPVPVGTPATWSLIVTNKSDFAVDAITVDGRFAGSAPFELDPSGQPACTVVAGTADTTVNCSFGTLSAGASVALDLTGSGPLAGDVLGSFAAASETQNDADPADNDAATALSIADAITRESAQTIAGYPVTAVAAGDLNGDGFVDLAAASDASANLLLFLNEPDPANDRKRRLADDPVSVVAAAGYNDVALADLDGDSDLDIVAAGAAGQPVGVFLNDGQSGFVSLPAFSPSVDIQAISAADVDGDGFPDLVLAGTGGNLLSRGTGVAGAFADPVAFGNATAVDIGIADLFGDARPEMVFANADGDAVIFGMEAGAATLLTSIPTGPTTSVVASDFSGDGVPDLLFGRDTTTGSQSTPSDPLFLNFSGTDPSFFESFGLGAAPTFSVLASDTDDDGHADAIVLNRSGAHQVFRNSGAGDGTFLLAPGQLAATSGRAATSGPLSADGRSDLVIGGPDGIAVYFSDGTGNFGVGDVTPPVITLLGSPSTEVTVGKTYVDAGATALDAVDGDLSDLLTVSSTVDTTLLGTYVVTYEVWDKSGNASTVSRSVEVTPRTPVGGGGGGAADPSLLALLLALSLIARAARARGARSRKDPADRPG